MLICFIHSTSYLLIPYPNLAHLSSHSKLVITGLFSTSMSLFLLCYIHSFIFCIPYMSDIIQYLSFFVWLISLSIIFSKSIHIASNGRISFFLCLSNILFCVCVYKYKYIHTHIFIYIYTHTTSSLSTHMLWILQLLPYLSNCK